MKQRFVVSGAAFRLAELISSSAIDHDVADARGYGWVTDREVLAELGFNEAQRKLVPGLLVPSHAVDGSGVVGHQFRPERPRRIDDKVVKYETVVGSEIHLDCNPLALPALKDVGEDLYITEGARKADAAVSQGLCCLSLPGVWGWKRNGVPLCDWEHVPISGRRVFVAYDSDVMTKPQVQGALEGLTVFLSSRGATVRWITLPAGDVDLFGDVVKAHLEDGEPARAVLHCHRLIQLWTAREGDDGEHALMWRGFLGRALTESCVYGPAEDVLGQLVVDRERVLGADDPLSFVTRGNLARAVGRGGRPEEAIVIAEQLLADRLRVLGPDHPSTLDTRGHLAQFHAAAGRRDRAVDMLLDLLADRQRILDPDDPVLASTRHNLASVSADGDAPFEAIEGLRQNVIAQTKLFGPDHPNTLDARGVVATFLRRRERYAEALPLFEALLADRARVLGELSPATLGTHADVAACLRELDRVDESIFRLRAICRVTTATHGFRELNALAMRAELVVSLMVNGDEEEVLVELDALRDDSSHLEPDVPLRRWVVEAIEVWSEGDWFDEDDWEDED